MPEDFFAVAPTDIAADRNVLRRPLQPFAFWQLDDIHFAFDSSLLLPSMTVELVGLIGLVRASPEAKLSVFGHTDTTGMDEYNKTLAGRRAMALYALLTRRTDLWEFLFTHPHGGDDWRRDDDFALALMRDTVGDDAHALARPALYDRYMTALATDPDGSAFGLPATAFLGEGTDAKGKADFQGCGEFNPLVMFSAAELKDFQRPERRVARDLAGAPNRRVAVFFFPAETRITVADWPCPRALEPTAGCRKRFWSDHQLRQSFQAAHREHPVDEDTFACRFYDRLAREAVDPQSIALQLVHSTPAASAPGAPADPPAGADVLDATSLTATVRVPAGADLGDASGRFRLFDLRPARRLISLRAELASGTRIHSNAVGINLVGLMARLPGADALRRAFGFALADPPPPTALDPPDSTLQDFDDLDRPFDSFEEDAAPEPDDEIAPNG